MLAVAPASALLSPYVGTLAAAVARATAELLGLASPLLGSGPPASVLKRGDAVQLDWPGLRVSLDAASPQARQAGRPLELRLRGGSADQRRAVKTRLAAGALPADGKRALALALDAWWPFAELPDEEFRKVSSAPSGAYGTLRLGYRCNQDCWFCWQDRRAPAPPEAMYWRWLDELAGLGIRALNLTGGEATTWPILPDLIARAAGPHQMVVSLQTNAVKLAKPEYTATLVQAGLRVAMVSLHSTDAGVSDQMTRAPGTHQRTVEGMKQALRAGLRLTITCVVEAANVDDLPAHARFVRDELLPLAPPGALARVTYAHPTSYFEAGVWQRNQVSFDRIRPALSQAVSTLRAVGVPVQVGGPCGFPVCALDPALVPDPYQVMERSVFSEAELQHRRFAPICAGCSHQARCFGLRQEYLDRFSDQGLQPG